MIMREPTATFNDKELALLKTFADQAVIAIQNARLFNETQEALEQQKAAAEILSVISNSVSDTKPVFDKILSSCKHLFGSDEMDVLLVDDQGLLQIAAYVGQGARCGGGHLPCASRDNARRPRDPRAAGRCTGPT